MDDRSARLTAVAVLGLVLLSPPLLAVFDSDITVFGVPLLWAYLFAAWAFVIALIAVAKRGPG